MRPLEEKPIPDHSIIGSVARWRYSWLISYSVVWVALLAIAFRMMSTGILDVLNYFFFSAFAVAMFIWSALLVSRLTEWVLPSILVITTFTLFLEEALLNHLQPAYGLGLALGATLALPVIGSLPKLNEDTKYALRASALVFAIRLAFIPFPQVLLRINVIPSVYALILILLIAFILLNRISLTRIGFSRGLSPLRSQVGTGILVGLFSGLVEYALLRPSPIEAGGRGLQASLYVIIVMTLFVGLGEEMLFRGLVQESYQRVLPAPMAILMASTQFGLMHYAWFNPFEILFAYGMGVVFGVMYWKNRSLIAPVIAHALGNIIMFHIAAYPEILPVNTLVAAVANIFLATSKILTGNTLATALVLSVVSITVGAGLLMRSRSKRSIARPILKTPPMMEAAPIEGAPPIMETPPSPPEQKVVVKPPPAKKPPAARTVRKPLTVLCPYCHNRLPFDEVLKNDTLIVIECPYCGGEFSIFR